MGTVSAITTTERKAAAVAHPPPEAEHLPCPRCSSTNTKFCYYNNYNFSQPRHFCKSCRRYWTHGGTLRDIPIGGGSRKSAKRSRTTPSSDELRRAPPVPVPGGSFTSLLNGNPIHTHGAGLFALGLGLDDVGFGMGRPHWPLYGIVEGGGGGSATAVHGDAGSFVGGEYLPFPDIAIPTNGSFFK